MFPRKSVEREGGGAELEAGLKARTEDGWGGKGRERWKEGRALRLIDHFLSEWSGLESSEKGRGEEFNLKIGISMGKGFAERGKGESVGRGVTIRWVGAAG